MNLRRWNVRHVREVLESAPAFAPFAQTGSAEWSELRDRLGTKVLADLVAQAEVDAQAPVPALPARLYHEFRETGRREGYEDAQRQRRSMLYRLVLAEWVEGKGRLVEAIENVAWARLEETNWAWPAHAGDLDTYDWPTLDLAAAMTALDMAEIDFLVGDRLSANLRSRLRVEVERRAVGPFLNRNDHWWLHTTPQKQVSNWTAVCVAGCVGAAIYLEPDTGRLAEIVARGLHSLADYLETFDREGGSSEGPDYWTYGFGNYAVLAHLLHARTGGKIDLLEGDYVRDIAQFPLRTMLGPGVWTSFSDSDHNPSFHPGLLSYLAAHLDLPGLTGLGMKNDFAVEIFNQFVWPLRQFAWPLDHGAGPAVLGAHDWYDEMGWMISRLDADPKALRLAAKGGHNDEMHNQNDVGSFMVVSGGKVVLTDPGRGRYSKAYFGPERYENFFASSLGHSVPVINGQQQAAGRAHAASVIEHVHSDAADRLVLDMAAAYPEAADLEKLQRSVSLKRDVAGGVVALEDRFRFKTGAGVFQSVLITPLDAVIEDSAVLVGDAGAGVRVGFDAMALDVSLDLRRGQEKQYQPSVDLTRIVFTPRQKDREGRVALEIAPLV